MPEPFTYAGLTPVSYTETRDAAGEIVGTVEHGDTREFGTEGDEKPDGAPDWWPAPDGRWITGDAELPEAWPGVSAQMYRQSEPAEAAEDSEDDAGAAAADEPAEHVAPLPAPPVSPPAFTPATTTAADGQIAEG